MSEFDKLIGGVKPIDSNDTSTDFYQKKDVSIDKKKYAERFEHSSISQSGYDIGSEDVIEFRREGVQHNILKKLSNGEMTVYESIDLHGMRTLEAEVYMATMIDSQRYLHQVCVRIVHGKGYHANDVANNQSSYKQTPKLKNFTARYLAEHPRVLAYHSCPVNRGGAGAVYVLLSKCVDDL